MLTNLVVLIVLLVALSALVWLVVSAQRIRSLPLRLLGTLPLVVLALVLLAGAGLMARGMLLVYPARLTPAADVRAEATPERIARGQQLATAVCAACHGNNGQLPLSGGFDLANDIPLPIGHFYAANLTPAGRVADWSDGDILRAMREGRDPAGRLLGAMPAQNLRNMSDEDALSIIAYLRSQPPTGEPPPPGEVAPLGLLMAGAGMFPTGMPPVDGPVVAPPQEISAEYGEYIVSYSDCRDCHGANLKGGTGPGPIGPNLQLAKSYTREQFIHTLRTGVNPGGRQLQPPMPWKQLSALGDVELGAIHEYLLTVQ